MARATVRASGRYALSAGALAGIKVIDFGQMVSAPFCAKLFADFGADVIKVEPPAGDAARATGPFPGDVPDPEKSGLYLRQQHQQARHDAATSQRGGPRGVPASRSRGRTC